ncbi:MAG: SDR family NAD(P)-dependent oxidoreductase [Flavobacteriales bacterium]|nr:SDR family NAD(P)-dependent oxidoreductase [Flavobacteriales bacterium]
MNLSGKVIWITGASSGIGEAITYALAKEGCKLIISSRRLEELNRVRKNIKLTDEDILVLPIDLEQHQHTDEWVKVVMGKFNRIDILINNGGISQKGYALETTQAVEQKIMDINYFGNVELSKATARIMQLQKSGKIVTIASIIGRFGLPDLSTYSASKHALYGFYDLFRLELKDDNIKVLIISPGFINTNVAINAIKGDGVLVNKNSPAMEQGMKTDVFAKKFITALKSNRNHKYIGKKEILSVPFKMLFPNIFYNLMYKMSKKNK